MRIKKSFVFTFLLVVSTSSFAYNDAATVKFCADSLQAQPGMKGKVSDSQARSYCDCTLTKFSEMQNPTQANVQSVIKGCMQKAGMPVPQKARSAKKK